MRETYVFVVEQAGCPSCAQRVHGALAPLGDVGEIEIDEDADEATVRLASGSAGQDAVDRALAAVSQGSGHAYRVKPGSWQST